MKYNRFNRRMFLQGSGSMLVIPFLPSILSSSAEAAVSVPPKYVHFSSNNCLPRSLTTPLYQNAYPSYGLPSSTNFNSVPWIIKDADTKYQSLTEIQRFQGKISFVVDEKWNPYLTRMNLVTNAHGYFRDSRHNFSANTACSVGVNENTRWSDVYGPLPQHSYSVDWLLEQAWGTSTPIPALRVNLSEDVGGYKSCAYGMENGVSKHLYMMQSLGELQTKLSAGKDNADLAKLQNRKSRIDSVLTDFKALMRHRRISSVDRKRLSDTADLWSQIDARLESDQKACTIPSIATTSTNWGVRHRAALDSIAQALACGMTRTVSYGLLQGGDNLEDQGLIHGWAHDTRIPNQSDPLITNPAYAQLLPWRASMFLHLLSRLRELTDENGQPLLDSSLVVWGHQYSNQAHGMLGHNLIMVGGANGRLETGWHVDAGGAPINRFHLTNMMALGLSQAQIERNGMPGFGEISAPTRTDDNSGNAILSEQDDKQNDNTKRRYDISKLSYFSSSTERRKPFPYLK